MPDKRAISEVTPTEIRIIGGGPITLEEFWKFKKEMQEKWAAQQAKEAEAEKWERRVWELVAIIVALSVAIAFLVARIV